MYLCVGYNDIHMEAAVSTFMPMKTYLGGLNLKSGNITAELSSTMPRNIQASFKWSNSKFPMSIWYTAPFFRIFG